MGRPMKDLAGMRFGKLIAISRVEGGGSGIHAKWLCQCDCGNTTVAHSSTLIRGRHKSCGCWLHEYNLTHGLSNTKLYRVWRSMRSRCENPNCKEYKWYGNRGISVCEEWHKYEQFHKWAIKNGYIEGLSIDRLDSHENYCPENCEWITRSENSRRARLSKEAHNVQKDSCG